MADPAQTPTKPQYRSPHTPLEGLRCNCPDLAVHRISRSAQNPGRPFWCCKRDRGDPHNCKFFKWEDDVSAPPTSSGGPESHKRPRSLSSATQESPRKKAILDTLLSEAGQTPPEPKASQTSATLWGHLGDTNDDDEELFNNSQAFKFNPLGGKYLSQASPSSAPAPFLIHTTSGLTLSTPPDSALRKGKTKDKSLFDPLDTPTHKARELVCASASSWSPSSLLGYQSSFRPSQETGTDDAPVFINAVRKLGELPAFLERLQRQVDEAETAKKLAELKLTEYEGRIRALQMENEHLKARQGIIIFPDFTTGSTRGDAT